MGATGAATADPALTMKRRLRDSGAVWVAWQSWYSYGMAHIEGRIIVGDRGRLVLPSAVRRELDLKPGTHMLLSTENDGSLRLRSYRAVAEQSRGLLRRLPGGSMVDELLAERRAEADREDIE
jgi:AbrB family transcriptional regulator (stage V sporulation protein T)